ncbi:MAG: glycoside hydrolase family 10 protein [Armatimonadota bacterium]
MRPLLFIVCLLVLTAGFAAEVTTIDDFNYADVAAMRAAWVESQGAPPAELFKDSGRNALKIMCPFATVPDCTRGCYDKQVKLDLTRAGSIVFDFYSDNPAPLSYCAIYFHSGEGWYGHSFGVNKGWNRISIGKGNFRPEDKPGGWGTVDMIRISAWKGRAEDTFCALANLHARTEDVAVVSGIIDGPEGRSANGSAALVSDLLTKCGVAHGVITDTDVEAGALAGQKLAILAYSPSLSDAAIKQIQKYVADGGKIMVFYSIRPALGELLGLKDMNWRQRKGDGDLAEVVFQNANIQGLPQSMRQGSWNINSFQPGGHNARVIGQWRSEDGTITEPAVLLSDNGLYMGHVLTEADTPAKKAFLMAMVGKFVPGAWEAAAAGAIEKARKVGPFADQAEYDAFCAKAQRDPGYGPKVTAALAAAAAADKQAKQLLAAKRYPEVQAAAQKLHEALAEAYIVAHRPRTAEFRAVWNHSGTGDCGSWDEAMKRLKAGGFNAVVPNMWWGGVAHYDSKLLPLSKTFTEKGDQIAQCVAAGKKYGIEVHPWKVNWNLSTAPKSFVEQMRTEGRLQMTAKGEEAAWLCPSHPRNFELERDTMLEVARNYDVDGIHFDYIRYPGGENCYCPGCRERFETARGAKVVNWPGDCYSGALRAEYRQFRCDQITRLVKTVSEEAHKLKPWIKVSAAVFSDYPGCKDGVGQDWVLWCKMGWLDFVCPMNYTDSNTRLTNLVANQTAYIGNSVPLYCGLGSWINTVDNTVAQMEIARSLGADGFICFHMGEDITLQGFPQFAKGITSEPAILPHNAPQVRFSVSGEEPGKPMPIPAGGLSMKVQTISNGQHRQQVTDLTGNLELQDTEGRKIVTLGELPRVGQSVDVTLMATPTVGVLRVAAVGVLTFADGTKRPFVTRSRAYLPAAK